MIAPWKGQDLFLHAALQVAKEGLPVEFYVLGDAVDSRDREFVHGLRRMVEESGYAERIHFMGFQTDVPRALRDLDVLVHTSILPEPWGMTILEGMACGLAVIASDEGGPKEIIRNGVDGVLVPPRDPNRLANAIRRLAQDPGEARGLGQRAWKRVAENFTVQRTVSELTTLYEGLVES